MKLLKLIPDETKIPFTKYRWYALVVTLVAFFASLFAIFVFPGLNFGVDFRGGITLELTDQQPVDIPSVRSALDRLGVEAVVQQFGAPEKVKIVTGIVDAGDVADRDAAQQVVVGRIEQAMRETLGADVVFDRREVVSPTVSGELVQRGIWAVVLASLGMMAYIWFRYQLQWGAGAVVGVVHDTVITIGLIALFQFSFDLNVIAAILTVIGYSVNDTVVVYDRIRENLRKYKKMELAALIDLSLNETLTRTVVTGGTSILALAALVIFGGEVLRGFCFAIMFGIIVGTYSSLFVAAPFLLLTGVKRDWSKVKVGETAQA
ncbi:MAG: protein translocase subunit SecF [Parvularculaceae bacterium]|nr:protein translocase subunit SecF [Parvularculaceae bacterium]